MKSVSFLRIIVAVACTVTATSNMYAQTNSILLFGPTNVRQSTNGTGFGANQVVFNSSTLALNCGSSPIRAVLSSTPDGTGNVLADNFVNLTVTTSSGSSGPVNVCRGGSSDSTPDGIQLDCFTPGYQIPAGQGNLTGQNPDTFTSTGGVAPIDISSSLQPGSIQIKIDLVDTGSFLASSTLYLDTSCTQAGVTGPAKVTGNPIPQNNPPASALTQNFPFDSSTNQQVQFTYDLSVAQGAGSLAITDGTIPNTADLPIDPLSFQPVWVPGTSFATSSCLIHTGELLPNGQPACKLFTLECQVGASSSESGAFCPLSKLRNEIFEDIFDGPSFTLPDITLPNGPTFHQGVGFLMAKEGWTGGPCIFDPAAGLGTELCPQNLLTDFSGPGLYALSGTGDHPNSTFIPVAGVPEDLTTVTVEGQHPGGWINSQTPTVDFSSQPPDLSTLVPALPGQSSFVPAPIQSITYGTALASAVPQPSPKLPIATDTVLTNSVSCPTSAAPTTPAASVFTASSQISFPTDGQYLLHYFAQDCAGTEELKFTQDANFSWSTSFYTVPINIDTVAPTVSSLKFSLAPSTNSGVANSYTLGEQVTVTYSCKDDRSGIVTCGTATFAPGTTLNTGPITNTVDTSSPGIKTFLANVVDAAGNHTSASATYQVVAPAVNLVIAKVAPLLVRHNDSFTYDIAAANLGDTTASKVVVTDPLPAGVTFLSATAQVFACDLRGCTIPSANAHCSFASNTVSCDANTLAPSKLLRFSALVIQIVVRADASKGTVIKNTASVSSANPDSHPGNNQSTASTLVR
ncbi:putative repeat protein (TIGR01451 family) [Edaphobacter aggregans]|uniref:Putative repeat protein (TIGR01451 family) n=1 Tax=Edaphobacter aggregans TaxID=570835 RepID=A0A428MI51_9BACT|nr:DUF11 domain-containing protein [Edaphobacter aggregans]RSL16537.1 putative repeat protein (TIGR01451 family) [Edaphobacter aggregans]